MVYNAQPPYEILQNRLIDFPTVQRLRRFAKYWDLVGNSGNFVGTTPLIWRVESPFVNFLRFSDWLYARLGRTDTIALARLAERLFEFLTIELKLDATLVAETLSQDWQRAGRRDVPEFLREFLTAENLVREHAVKSSLPKRQARHSGTGVSPVRFNAAHPIPIETHGRDARATNALEDGNTN